MATSDVDVAIGGRLRQRRLALGISMREVGEQMDPPVATQQISKFERGENRIAAAQIIALSKVLGMSPAEILGINAAPSNREVAVHRLAEVIADLPQSARDAVAHLVRVMRKERARLTP